MEDTAILWMVALETVFAGAIYLVLPRIARHGLLFGVYVGEERATAEAAQRIRRLWTRWVVAATTVTVALQLLLRRPLGAILCLALFTMGLLCLYLWSHFASRALAPTVPPPPAVAVLEDDGSGGILPHATLAFAVACGLLALAYAGVSYSSLPERIPTHFGLSGAPDGWSAKSLGSVLLLPFLGVIQGFVLGLLCLLVSQAKRAVRLNDGGASLRAQHAFRRAMTRFLCGITWLVSLTLLIASVFAIRTAQGRSAGLPMAVLGLAGLLLVVALGGIVVLAVRYGQGGARLEGAATAPLTDGLADNRYWVLGMFYVNRNDPSIMVENRFGLGYTLNFGNWKAVVGLVGLLVFVLGLTLFAILAVR